jgi:hypothetical protein
MGKANHLANYGTAFRGLIALVGIISVCGCRTGPICILQAVPKIISPAEITDQWIGFTTTDTSVYRLVLKPDSTGLLTQAYTSTTNQETLRFEILRWDLATNNVLTCIFRPLDAGNPLEMSWPVRMTCSVKADQLEATLQNRKGGWNESILFQRERDLDEKLKALRQ